MNPTIEMLLYIFALFAFCNCNKYSAKANMPEYTKLTQMEKPFRMQKNNLIWGKAVQRLPPEKLKLIYTDLKYQDKEELNWKSEKAHGKDKSGLKESLIQKSFKAILEKYGLLEDYKALEDAAVVPKPAQADMPNDVLVKSVFRDKKLNKLWNKAQKQGFSDEQLAVLKEEFNHHQNKIDQYYQIMNNLHKKPSDDDWENSVDQVVYAELAEKVWKSENPHQILKEKHSELKKGYKYLNQQIIPDTRNLQFEEPQVNTLWDMARNASFTPEELDSLKNELHHFEHRLKKLKTLTEMEMDFDPTNVIDEVLAKKAKKLKEYDYKVKKIHKDITSRILEKHSEL